MNAHSKQHKEEEKKPLSRLCATSLPSPADATTHELCVNGEVRSGTTSTAVTKKKPKKASLQQLIDDLSTSLSALNADPSLERLESLAVLILESMTRSGRVFHNLGHIFDISQNADAITMLSALFHDVVYYNVDGGFTPTQEKILDGLVTIDEENKSLTLKDSITAENDEILSMIMDLYGFKPGSVLNPFGGQNEFLSAVIAVRALTDILTKAHLAQIAACIEATIPFRPIDSEGNTPADILHQRFLTVNTKYNLQMTEKEIIDTIHRSVDLTNRDVGNFASTNTGYFLEQTWKLLPESNVNLRHRAMYSVYDYYMALYKLEKFFSFLDPKVVFRYFQDVPTKEKRQEMNEQAALNIEIGCGYIRVKLLSIGVLAAMAQLTGGDAPISMFVGDYLPFSNTNDDGCSIRLDDQFPPVEIEEGEEEEEYDLEDKKKLIERSIYELLSKGRNADSTFDYRSSPMAAHLYRQMNKHNHDVKESLRLLEAPMMNEEQSKAFLESLPRDVIRDIAHHVALITEHRAEKILNVVKDL